MYGAQNTEARYVNFARAFSLIKPRNLQTRNPRGGHRRAQKQITKYFFRVCQPAASRPDGISRGNRALQMSVHFLSRSEEAVIKRLG